MQKHQLLFSWFFPIILMCIGTALCQLIPMKDVDRTSGRIVGGREATVGQFPWQVGIIVQRSGDDRIFCSGSLISPNYVLTAAHCTNGAQNFSLFAGSLTITDQDPNRIDVNSTEFIQHKDFNNGHSLINDIALIKLPKAVPLNARIKVITLATREIPNGTKLTISGWGATKNGSVTRNENLKYVTLDTTSISDCDKAYKMELYPGVLCVTTTKTESTCSGDSGGPAVLNAFAPGPVLEGIVSFGHSNGCESGQPVGFTRIDYHREWIRNNSDI